MPDSLSPFVVDRSAAARLAYGLLFFSGLTLYALTAPTTVAFEDDGFFIMAAYHLGIAHPPGYPLHSLIGHVFSQLPLGSVAYRVHLMSACFAAGTGVLVAMMVRGLGVGLWAALAGGAALLVSGAFWSQAVIAEVYSLNAFFLVLLMYVVISRRMPTGRQALYAGLVTGAGLSVHLPLFVLAGPAVLSLVTPAWWSRWKAVAVGIILGLLPYLWLVLRSHQQPVFSYQDPIMGWADFWHMLSRADYAGIDQSVTAGLTDKLAFLGFYLSQLAVDYIGVAVVLAALGMGWLWKQGHHRLLSALLWLVLGHVLVLIALLGFDFEAQRKILFRVYPLLAYVGVAVLAGYGLGYVGTRFGTWGRVLGVLLLVLPLGMNLPAQDRSGDWLPDAYARVLNQVLEEGASVMAIGDGTVGVLGYTHYVEGQRPDLTLVTPSGRTFEAGREIRRQHGAKGAFEVLTTADRPVYMVGAGALEQVHEDAWLTHRLGVGIERTRTLPLDDPHWSFAERLLTEETPRDPWGKAVHHALLSHLVRYLMTREGEQGLNAQEADVLKRAVTRSYSARLMGLSLMLRDPQRYPQVRLEEELKALQAAHPAEIFHREEALYAFLTGEINRRGGRLYEAEQAFLYSLSLDPYERNTSARGLRVIYEGSGRQARWDAVIERFPTLDQAKSD